MRTEGDEEAFPPPDNVIEYSLAVEVDAEDDWDLWSNFPSGAIDIRSDLHSILSIIRKSVVCTVGTCALTLGSLLYCISGTQHCWGELQFVETISRGESVRTTAWI